MLLTPRPVSSDLFTGHRENDAMRVLVAEMSDLPGDLERVWNDACDVGLTIVSQRTGRSIVFCVEHEQRDAEGDLMWLDLRPASLTERRRHPNLIVRLYND